MGTLTIIENETGNRKRYKDLTKEQKREYHRLASERFWKRRRARHKPKALCLSCGYEIAPGNSYCGECLCEDDGV